MKKLQKNGISLIVLVVTIVVIIILASVVILNLTDNGTRESAVESVFKNDLAVFKEELFGTISDRKLEAASNGLGYRVEEDVDLDYVDVSTSENVDEMKKYIPSFSEKYKAKFAINLGELVYIGNMEREEKWAAELGVFKMASGH